MIFNLEFNYYTHLSFIQFKFASPKKGKKSSHKLTAKLLPKHSLRQHPPQHPHEVYTNMPLIQKFTDMTNMKKKLRQAYDECPSEKRAVDPSGRYYEKGSVLSATIKLDDEPVEEFRPEVNVKNVERRQLLGLTPLQGFADSDCVGMQEVAYRRTMRSDVKFGGDVSLSAEDQTLFIDK